jgi:RNA polymerase sigma factor (sigma-70 family)
MVRMGRDNGEPVDEEIQTYLAAQMYAQAWKLLADSYYGAVFRYCVGMLDGDLERARDVTQDVFTEVSRALSRYRGDAMVRTWLLTVARNLCWKHLKRGTTRGAKARSYPEMIADHNHCPPPPDPALRALSQEQLRQLRRALAQLPHELREVLVLLYGLGDFPSVLSADEIAGIVGISRATVYRRRDEGLAELRRIMHDG